MGYRLTDDYIETVVETVFGSKPRLEKSLNEKESLETICRNVTNYFLDKKTKYITISLNFNLNPDRCKGCDSYGFSIIDISTKQILLSESRFNSLDELKEIYELLGEPYLYGIDGYTMYDLLIEGLQCNYGLIYFWENYDNEWICAYKNMKVIQGAIIEENE